MVAVEYLGLHDIIKVPFYVCMYSACMLKPGYVTFGQVVLHKHVFDYIIRYNRG